MARVKQIRLARGLTQEQFAERADLDPKFYQHAEAGRKPNPELQTLLKLAKGCGLTLSELFDFEREPQAFAEDPVGFDQKASPKALKARKTKATTAKVAKKV